MLVHHIECDRAVTLATWAGIRHRQLKVVRDRGKAVLKELQNSRENSIATS